MLYINYFGTVFVAFLFCDDLTGDLIVQLMQNCGATFFTLQSWHFLRALIVLSIICLRLLTYRDELQFEFDKSYVLISKLLQQQQSANLEQKHKDTLFIYIRSRVSQIYYDTWRLITCQFTQFALPFLLMVIYLNRLLTYSCSFTFSETEVAVSGFDVQPFDFSETLAK